VNSPGGKAGKKREESELQITLLALGKTNKQKPKTFYLSFPPPIFPLFCVQTTLVLLLVMFCPCPPRKRKGTEDKEASSLLLSTLKT